MQSRQSLSHRTMIIFLHFIKIISNYIQFFFYKFKISFNQHMSVGEVMVFLDQSSNSKIYAIISHCQSTYALKVIQHNSPANECSFEHQRECSHLRNEFDLLSVLDHPSITKPIGFSCGKDACQLRTELAQCSL